MAYHRNMEKQQLQFDFDVNSNINTHLGKISSAKLGVTLVHEHVFNKYHYSKKDFVQEYTVNELKKLKKYNIKTIVDLTPYTSLSKYDHILRTKDVQIICCIGFFLSKYVPYQYKRKTVPELVNILSRQIENGVRGSKIKPGIFKIASQRVQLSTLEKRFFDTIGILQKKYHFPIATHSPKGALNHIKRLIDAGANPKHIFISHLDKGLSSKNFKYNERFGEIKKVLDTGAYVLFCEFGNGKNHSKTTKIVMKILKDLKKLGYIKQILISADSNWRWKYGEIKLKNSRWGGIPRNYEYVFTCIQPILHEIGFTDDDIKEVLVNNPKRLFEF